LPSPIGHSLVALGLLRVTDAWQARRGGAPAPGPATPATRRERLWLLGALLVAANAPDFDFLPGILLGEPGLYHHGPPHSLAAAILAGGLAAGLARWLGLQSPRRFGLLVGLVFASHLLVDMMSTDRRFPIGVALFWPVYNEYLDFPFRIFLDIKRDPDASGFVTSLWMRHNAIAVVWELVVAATVIGAIRLTRLVSAISGDDKRPPLYLPDNSSSPQ
jgi:hypothetical protein